ncbi:MAG: hypothetical protein QOH06_2222 [Acidobacteriota bacterium]|nr:hypothetical protein [Acidobacteriota bacterium]
MPVFPGLFCVYWLSVLLWWRMAERLCAGLSGRHPLLWAALGRTAGRELAILGFLLRRRDRYLEDRSLIRLCGAMRVLLAAYVAFFLMAPALLAVSIR